MKLENAINRDRKRNKNKNGMRISGRSIFLLEEQKQKKAEKNKAKWKKEQREFLKELEG
jgi:hypothetical protein